MNNRPITKIVAVTPSDDTELPIVARALYVGTTGDVSLITEQNDEVTLPNLVAGIWHPIVFRQIKATDTNASEIFAGY